MACPRCFHAVRSAGLVLQEMHALDQEDLLPGTDWLDLADRLIALSNHLEAIHQQQLAQAKQGE